MNVKRCAALFGAQPAIGADIDVQPQLSCITVAIAVQNFMVIRPLKGEVSLVVSDTSSAICGYVDPLGQKMVDVA